MGRGTGRVEFDGFVSIRARPDFGLKSPQNRLERPRTRLDRILGRTFHQQRRDIRAPSDLDVKGRIAAAVSPDWREYGNGCRHSVVPQTVEGRTARIAVIERFIEMRMALITRLCRGLDIC